MSSDVSGGSTAGAEGVRRPPGRRDFERNRRRIIAAACQLIREHHSIDIQLEQVAEVAGVARATLFRHIGSRQAMLEMVYDERTADISAVTDEALTFEDPWDGVVFLFHALARFMNQDGGLWQYASGVDFASSPAWRPMIAKLEQVLSRARADGSLVADITYRDIVPLIGFAALPPNRVGNRWPLFTDIVLGGLRSPQPRS